jgi:2-dehydro-3-deoxygalactonokinase
MIGVDWGTSSFRAFRLDAAGRVLDRVATRQGIMQVPPGGFPSVLREAVAPWLAAGEDRILLSGMVGSRQGWQEAAYLPCPAGPGDIAAHLADIAFDGAQVRLVPGLSAADADGVPEVMRGEETQLIGLLERIGAAGVVCLPGTHSKWVTIAGGRIAGFTTHMTGEVFAVLRGHTILGRMMQDGAADEAAFAAGLARARDGGGLLHHLFGVRTLGLSGRLADTAAPSYLSGLLLGHEVAAALPPGAEVLLVGDAALCRSYAAAILAFGGRPEQGDPEAAARGLALIGALAAWR